MTFGVTGPQDWLECLIKERLTLTRSGRTGSFSCNSKTQLYSYACTVTVRFLYSLNMTFFLTKDYMIVNMHHPGKHNTMSESMLLLLSTRQIYKYCVLTLYIVLKLSMNCVCVHSTVFRAYMKGTNGKLVDTQCS